jgi:hypothetical protein
MDFLLPDIANTVRLRRTAVRFSADTPTMAVDPIEAGLLR